MKAKATEYGNVLTCPGDCIWVDLNEGFSEFDTYIKYLGKKRAKELLGTA